MNQPDLVSKLRELKAKVEASRDGFLDGKPYILTYSDIIVELESFIGLAKQRMQEARAKGASDA